MNRLNRAAVAASALVYVVATAAMGRAALADLDGRIVSDLADPVLNAAILAWNAMHVPWTEAWYQFPNFHPGRDTLTFSEHLLGVSVIAAPIYWATGDAAVAYNLTLLAAYPLCGLAMFALAWTLTRSHAAAFVAGLVFAFAPYRASQIAHIQALTSFWAPLALVGLHRFLSEPGPGRLKWLVLFAASWLLQGASNSYYLVYFSVLVGLWVLWFVLLRRRWRNLAWIAAAGLVAVLPLIPILLRFLDVHRRYGLTRPMEEIAFYSADIASIVCAPPLIAAWGWLQPVPCSAEALFFPGVTLLVLCLAGLVVTAGRRVRDADAQRDAAVVAFYAVAAVLTWSLTWGPLPTFDGKPALSQGPFAWLLQVPGVGGLRVPGRFWMMTLVCLSVLAGCAMAALTRRTGRLAPALVALVSVGLLADGWSNIPAPPLLPGPPDPAALRGAVTMTLPLGANRDYDSWSEFHAVVGGWTTVNGYSGFEPPVYFALRDASARAHPALLLPFASATDLQVMVLEGEAGLTALVAAQPGAEQIAHANGWRQYRVPHAGAMPPATLSGMRHPIESVSVSCLDDRSAFAIDGDLQTRWHCEVQRVGQQLTADLGRVVPVATVVDALGPYRSDYPRRLLIETSVDGASWEQAWNGEVMTQALAAGLHDPAAFRLVLPFTLRPARYVRLRSLADDPTWYWSIAELEVWSGSG